MDGLAKWWAFALPIAEKWWPIGFLPIALVAVWWLWWKLPKREVAKLRHSIRNSKDRVDVEDTLRKTIGQAIGAVAVLIGAGFALAQFLEQRQASQDLLISNQIAKGFEQLGSDKIEVRLGGIYALEGIMNTPNRSISSSPDYRQPVLEALCAFVREHTIGMIVAERPTTDVQAVLTVIGRRPKELRPVDLSGAVVPGAALQNANLAGVALLGANLHRADLIGANLHRAFLDFATLNQAIMFNANLSTAMLSSANLSGAILFNANLSSAFLSSADLSGAILSDANLSDAHLNGANLSDADLSDADLTGLSLDNQEQLSKACGKPKVLPEGFTLDRPCHPKHPK
jgi:uncharacterized protein YjbI with pentapeptide repeats